MMRIGAICVLIGIALEVQAATVPVLPDADGFVRSLAPASNYGGGGALSVSGAAAVNGSGQQNGLFDTLMRFPMSNVVTSLDEALGENWIVTGARLVVTEMAIPDNAIFNRGTGQFEIRWIASDDWIEGTGKPNVPTSDGVTWLDLPAILNSNLDSSLGVFTNAGADVQISFGLELRDAFVSNIRSGGELGLYLTAASADIGFTFNSRNFGNTNAQPKLEISALSDPRPSIDTIVVSETNSIVSFNTASNWSYNVLGADNLAGPWSNLWSLPVQSTNGYVMFVDGERHRERYYRLKVSPE